jgi:hypothetical protein
MKAKRRHNGPERTPEPMATKRALYVSAWIKQVLKMYERSDRASKSCQLNVSRVETAMVDGVLNSGCQGRAF